ncbi:MAG: M3 family oligoendopeptidase [Candidatus Carbobacillus sp.]|nr:M3 family oligoendopeptidase [Candidatus Carbobacillus sp.]
MPYQPTWNLDVIFPGGSHSEELTRWLTELETDLNDFAEETNKPLPTASLEATLEALQGHLRTYQALSARLREAGAYVSCLVAQNVKDEAAVIRQSSVRRLGSLLQARAIELEEMLVQLPESHFEALLNWAEKEGYAGPLREWREKAREKMNPALEKLASALSADGYHAWGEMYNSIVGRLTVTVHIDGEKKTFSIGQASNLLAHPSRTVRQEVFTAYEKAWDEVADLNARILGHLSGFRLALYEKRGWHDILFEPLRINRMQRETLEAMWDAVIAGKPRLVDYLNHKAKRLGLNKLSMYDVDAPLFEHTETIPYDDGAQLIIEQFGRFDPELSAFAKKAFEERWIEAEDRSGKRPGGFCTSFPIKGQSRIFMTYQGTMDNVSTLAHELGHAYHQHVMNDLPPLAQQYAMNVAETASTFAEHIVNGALIERADADARAALIDQKLSRSVAFFMNIHARFLFETRFYEARKKGMLSVQELRALMTEAQKEAYMEALETYHPDFWQSKLHFFITSPPFYNFPYTFGFLFSTGLYARAKAEGSTFAKRYVALLRDTGRMDVETLAQKHLGVDLKTRTFWDEAVKEATAEVDAWLAL